MNFLDIDRVLDKRIVIVYPGNQPVSQFSRKTSMSFQSALHFGEGNLELSYFIPEALNENREVSILLAQTKAKKDGGLYFMNYPFSQPTIFKALEEMFSNGASAVLDNVFLEDGDYYLSIRFHSNHLAFLSDYLMNYSDSIDGLNISYLGKNPGLPQILAEVSRVSDIARIDWSVTVPDENNDNELYQRLGNEWVSEVRYMTTGKRFSELFRTAEKIKDPEGSGLRVISEEENLYEQQFKNKNSFVGAYHKKSYESRVIRFSRNLHYVDGKLHVSGVIPRMQTRNLLRILAQCKEDFPDWNLTIDAIDTDLT